MFLFSSKSSTGSNLPVRQNHQQSRRCVSVLNDPVLEFPKRTICRQTDSDRAGANHEFIKISPTVKDLLTAYFFDNSKPKHSEAFPSQFSPGTFVSQTTSPAILPAIAIARGTAVSCYHKLDRNQLISLPGKIELNWAQANSNSSLGTVSASD